MAETDGTTAPPRGSRHPYFVLGLSLLASALGALCVRRAASGPAGWALPAGVFIAGAGIALLLFGLTRSLSSWRAVAERKAEELRRTQEFLLGSRARKVAILEAAPDAIFLVDEYAKIVMANPAAQRNFGLAPGELTGRDLNTILMPGAVTGELTLTELLLAGGGPDARVELLGRRQDGHEFPVELSLARTRLPDQRMNGTRLVAAFVRDISDRKRADEEIRRAHEEVIELHRLEKEHVEAELDKARRQLVQRARLAAIGQVSASIAHDLRNPLAAIMNAAYLLKRRLRQDPKLVEFLQIIEEEVRASDRIITGLMEMTRGKAPAKSAVDLEQLVQAAFDRAPGADRVHCQARFDRSPFIVHADPDQMRQVFGNLITNAVQAIAGAGEIVVAGQHQAEADVVLVTDSGSGVAPELRANLFEPLFTTKAKGTGLGLVLCRQIIERHGGSIDYVENGARGATFRIVLPHPCESRPAADPIAVADGNGA
jgi:PAS domain S-box-containing protein